MFAASRPEFSRRHEIYHALDRDFSGRTRFFAAAAITNQIFATLFRAAPNLVTGETGNFLSNLGAQLEVANMRFAEEIRRTTGGGSSLDRYLVFSEQRLVQDYVGVATSRPAAWARIGSELNRLLNGTHPASLAAALVSRTRHYRSVLTEARRQMGVDLDFADEEHRVTIGCALIRHVRHDTTGIAALQRAHPRAERERTEEYR